MHQLLLSPEYSPCGSEKGSLAVENGLVEFTESRVSRVHGIREAATFNPLDGRIVEVPKD